MSCIITILFSELHFLNCGFVELIVSKNSCTRRLRRDDIMPIKITSNDEPPSHFINPIQRSSSIQLYVSPESNSMSIYLYVYVYIIYYVLQLVTQDPDSLCLN